MAQTDLQVYESAQDLVVLLDAETLQPLVDAASAMGVRVREPSRVTSYDVEDGTSRADHRVILPVEISFALLLTSDERNQFEQLRAAFLDGREVIAQTKVRSYDNLIIADFPHDELPSQGQSVAIALTLKEIRTATVQFGPLPAAEAAGTNGNPAQQDTKSKGSQQTSPTTTATARQASVLHGVFF